MRSARVSRPRRNHRPNGLLLRSVPETFGQNRVRGQETRAQRALRETHVQRRTRNALGAGLLTSPIPEDFVCR